MGWSRIAYYNQYNDDNDSVQWVQELAAMETKMSAMDPKMRTQYHMWTITLINDYLSRIQGLDNNAKYGLFAQRLKDALDRIRDNDDFTDVLIFHNDDAEPDFLIKATAESGDNYYTTFSTNNFRAKASRIRYNRNEASWDYTAFTAAEPWAYQISAGRDTTRAHVEQKSLFISVWHWFS